MTMIITYYTGDVSYRCNRRGTRGWKKGNSIKDPTRRRRRRVPRKVVKRACAVRSYVVVVRSSCS